MLNTFNFEFLTIIEDEDDKRFILSLYEQYYPVMKRKAYSIVGGKDSVDDLIQDAFLKLIPKISLLRSLESYKLTSYVVNTIKHVCLDHIRKEARRVKRHVAGSNDDIAGQVPDLFAATEENFVKREEVNTLEETIMKLSERDRSLLYFKYNMGFKDKEIGTVLGIPSQHVRQYVARARQRVLQMLAKGEGYNEESR